jgi:hypothetical protein
MNSQHKRIENNPKVEIKKKKIYNTKNKKYLLKVIKDEIEAVNKKEKAVDKKKLNNNGNING